MASKGKRAENIERVIEDQAGYQEEENEDLIEASAYQRDYEDDRSWDLLEEDEYGRLRPLDRTNEQRAKRRRLLSEAQRARIRRGMIRYMQLIIDMSRASSVTDFRPTRIAVMSGVVQTFIRKFFDDNPLSQLGLIVLREGVAEVVTEMSGSPESHISGLRSNLDAGGDASLQNGLDLAVNSLKSIPPYGHREILVLFAGLSSCDPGNVFDTIKSAKTHKCRVSIVGLAAEMFVCKKATMETGGTYAVAINESHLEELVLSHAPAPPALAANAGANLVQMGFPLKNAEGKAAATFVGMDCELKSGGYSCPRCKAQLSDLPCSCHICRLVCVSAPHLARSYHHLFPVPVYEELPPSRLPSLQGCGSGEVDHVYRLQQLSTASLYCFGCMKLLGDGGEDDLGVIVQCPKCGKLYCFDCDIFVHETLHNCPGCECMAGTGDMEE